METNYINDVGLPLVQVLMEINEADEVQARYTYGNDLISMQNEQLSINNYYHYDGLGSTRQLTNSTETVVASYTYDAFGNLIASSGSSDNTYGFTGEQFDDSSGLLYLRARYYDASIGRFISRDLIGIAGGINLYAYVKNNPINHTDPIGLGDRYDICNRWSGIMKNWCKKTVDAACNSSAGAAKQCCFTDKTGCLTDKKCTNDTSGAEAAICEAKYLKCLAGIKQKE